MGFILVFGCLFSSCATILGGKQNTLFFTYDSHPVAEVYLDGKAVGNAPGKVKVREELIQHGSHLELRAEGYAPKEYVILRRPHGEYVLLGILTGGVPLLVDFATGAIYRPSPRHISYILDKTAGQ